MHALYGSADPDTDGSFGRCSADSVVEDEDAGGTGAVRVIVSFIQKDSGVWGLRTRLLAVVLFLGSIHS